MTVLFDLRRSISKRKRSVIFSEQSDPRVRSAVRTLLDEGKVQPVCLHSPVESIEGLIVFDEDPDKEVWLEKIRDLYTKRRATRQIGKLEAEVEIAANDLLLAALLVNAGYVDAGISGSLASTAEVLRAGIRGIGLAESSNLVSSCFLMQFPNKTMTFGDCGVVPDPDENQLAQIAIASARSHQLLTGEEPKVGLLSYSTKGSASHARVDKVRAAVSIAQKLKPELKIDGELQFDAAFLPEIGEIKAPGSMVAGQANVFIFPDLDAGNIAYKIAQWLAGAQALGPVIQGLAKPWLDLSRGCSVADIVEMSIIAAALVNNNEHKGLVS